MSVSEQPGAQPSLRLLFAAALLIRLLFVLVLHPTRAFLFSDMQSYDLVALELLSGQRSVWHAFRPVGYSMLLACIYALTDVSRTFVGVLQALMGAALAPLSVRLARAAGVGRTASALVGWGVATSLPLVLYCGLLLTEIPSAFFLVLGLTLLMVEETSPGWRPSYLRLIQSGLCFGLAGALRPNFLLVYPVLLLYLLRALPPSGLRRASCWLALVLGLVLPLTGVCAYNSHVLGRPAGPSANGGLNFYLNFADVHAIQYRGPLGQYWISPVPNGFDHTRIELTHVPLFEDAYYYGRGLAYIGRHPSALIDALQNLPEAAGIGRQLLWPHWPGHERLLRGYTELFFLVVLLPACAALLLLGYRAYRRRAQTKALTLAALCASSALPIYLFLGDPRVRVPFDPLLILLAGLAFDSFGRVLSERFAAARARTAGRFGSGRSP